MSTQYCLISSVSQGKVESGIDIKMRRKTGREKEAGLSLWYGFPRYYSYVCECGAFYLSKLVTKGKVCCTSKLLGLWLVYPRI